MYISVSRNIAQNDKNSQRVLVKEMVLYDLSCNNKSHFYYERYFSEKHLYFNVRCENFYDSFASDIINPRWRMNE